MRQDDVVSPAVSQDLFDLADEPKELVLYPGAGHSLEEAGGAVHDQVLSWVLQHVRNRHGPAETAW